MSRQDQSGRNGDGGERGLHSSELLLQIHNNEGLAWFTEQSALGILLKHASNTRCIFPVLIADK